MSQRTVDLGNLAVFDLAPLDNAKQCKQYTQYVLLLILREPFLLEYATENLKMLLTELNKLERETTVDGVFIVLPAPLTALPRAKAVPKPKEPTRWEKFAAVKGIQKRKRGAKVYDEEKGDWRARHGAQSRKNDKMADWISELKPGQEIEE